MPTLIQKHQDKVRITKLKKAYSVLSNAYQFAVLNYDDVDSWGLPEYSYTSQEYASAIGEKLIVSIKTDRICAVRNDYHKCFTGKYNTDAVHRNGFLDGTGAGGANYFTFQAGSLVYGISPYFDDLSNHNLHNKKYYATITVYLEPYLPSGKAYVYGKNVFDFILTSKGIIPAGMGNYSNFNSYAPLPFDVYCVDNSGKYKRGMGCTAWVLKNENFDYLKCPEKIGWDKASACK